MEYRRLGNSGLQVSALSLGSWVTFGSQIADDVAEKLMHTAYEAGVNFFDNAEVYASGKSEIVMGTIRRLIGIEVLILFPVKCFGADNYQIKKA